LLVEDVSFSDFAPQGRKLELRFRTRIPLSSLILALKENELRVSNSARAECKKKKSIQLASNALFLFVTLMRDVSNCLVEDLKKLDH
jgi:hypothetical protein